MALDHVDMLISACVHPHLMESRSRDEIDVPVSLSSCVRASGGREGVAHLSSSQTGGAWGKRKNVGMLFLILLCALKVGLLQLILSGLLHGHRQRCHHQSHRFCSNSDVYPSRAPGICYSLSSPE